MKKMKLQGSTLEENWRKKGLKGSWGLSLSSDPKVDPRWKLMKMGLQGFNLTLEEKWIKDSHKA